jgi:hypothetical protein
VEVYQAPLLYPNLFEAHIVKEISHGNIMIYEADISKVYEGCLETDTKINLITSSSTASCGVNLNVGVEYSIQK